MLENVYEGFFLSTYIYGVLKFHQRVQVISTSFLGIVYNIISFVHCFFRLHSSCVHMMIFFLSESKGNKTVPSDENCSLESKWAS